MGTTLTLLSYGADVNSTSSIPWRLQSTKIYTKDEHPLVVAAELGDIPMARLLLYKGADPNALTLYKSHDRVSGTSRLITSRAALHWAVVRKDVALVAVLLNHGARTELRGRSGDTVFHLVVRCISWWSYHNGTRAWDLRDQQCQEQCKILQMLLNGDPNNSTVNVLNEHGFSPLYQAVMYGCIRKVQLLLDAGADPNHYQLNMEGNGSPLHVAVYSGFYDIAQTLLHNGTNMNATNLCGHTPLLSNMLRCKGWDAMDASLIVHGANLEVGHGRGSSLIGLCIRNMKGQCEATCRLLFYAGCSSKEESWQRPFDWVQSRVTDLCDWLRGRKHNPHTLKDMSRIYIRNFLCENVTNGTSIAGTVAHLPLPRSVQDYLLLKELVDIDCFPYKADVTRPGVVQR